MSFAVLGDENECRSFAQAKCATGQETYHEKNKLESEKPLFM
jgi:hypothetical protein